MLGIAAQVMASAPLGQAVTIQNKATERIVTKVRQALTKAGSQSATCAKRHRSCVRATLGCLFTKMVLRWGCGAAICFGLAPGAEAAEHSGLIHRASCAVVRFYVAKYSASAAEMWARSHGATDAEIEAARHCLKSPPSRTAQAAP
jgi:hypothetical protein